MKEDKFILGPRGTLVKNESDYNRGKVYVFSKKIKKIIVTCLPVLLIIFPIILFDGDWSYFYVTIPIIIIFMGILSWVTRIEDVEELVLGDDFLVIKIDSKSFKLPYNEVKFVRVPKYMMRYSNFEYLRTNQMYIISYNKKLFQFVLDNENDIKCFEKIDKKL